MNQLEVAKEAGIGVRTYRGWEHGETVPMPGPQLRAVAAVFRVTSLYLLYGREDNGRA
jgi:transcriptional regulator with XRE-family HTH domain